MRNSQPEPPPAADMVVRERIEAYRAAHGGVFPEAIVVSREEFTVLLEAVFGAHDYPPTFPAALKIMGVDIRCCDPPTYPWGTFPTRAARAPGVRYFWGDDEWPTP